MMNRGAMGSQMVGNRRGPMIAKGTPTGKPAMPPAAGPRSPMIMNPGRAPAGKPAMPPATSPGGPIIAKRMAKGGKVSRGDGCCMKGKTKGTMY